MVKTVGIAKNGIIIRPGTADYFDASSPRGHSCNRSSGWNLDGMGPDNTLGWIMRTRMSIKEGSTTIMASHQV